MVDSDRIDRLIAAVPHALALRAGLDLGIFTRLAGGAATADSLGAALEVDPDRLSNPMGRIDSQFLRGGVARDAINRVTGYYIREGHPNDLGRTAKCGGSSTTLRFARNDIGGATVNPYGSRP